MEFFRQESWSGLPFPLQGIFPTQGSNLHLLLWQADSVPLCHLGSPERGRDLPIWWDNHWLVTRLCHTSAAGFEWTQSVYPSKGTGLEEGDTRCGCLHFNCGDSTLLVLEMEEGWGREREHSLRAQVVSWALRNSHLSPTHKALNCANMWMSLEADSFLECWSSMLKMFFNLG